MYSAYQTHLRWWHVDTLEDSPRVSSLIKNTQNGKLEQDGLSATSRSFKLYFNFRLNKIVPIYRLWPTTYISTAQTRFWRIANLPGFRPSGRPLQEQPIIGFAEDGDIEPYIIKAARLDSVEDAKLEYAAIDISFICPGSYQYNSVEKKESKLTQFRYRP